MGQHAGPRVSRHGALERDSRARDLARELLNGPLHVPPSVTAPEQVIPSEIDHKSNPWHKAAWGGRLGKHFLQPTDRDSGPLLQEDLGYTEPTHVRQGYTPLHWAAEHGAVGMARLLCKAEVAKRAWNSEGMIPWDLLNEAGSSVTLNCVLLQKAQWVFHV